ncbi:hypothetical protein AB205_0068780, partial [Aquarana catesbeiana]
MPNSKVNDQWVSLPFGQLFREVGLYDMWRKLHLEENVYTCYSKTHNTLSEIELDLYSADFISYVLDVSIKPREMVEMMDISKRADYDGKYGPYPNPNVRQAKIMSKVVRVCTGILGYDDPKIN